MNKTETKKGILELLFWFCSLTLLRMVLFLLASFFRPNLLDESAGHFLFVISKGNIGMAMVITLLNRLLPKLLNKVK